MLKYLRWRTQQLTSCRTTTLYQCGAAKRQIDDCKGVSCTEREHHPTGKPIFAPHRPSRPVFDPTKAPWLKPSANSSFPSAPIITGGSTARRNSSSPTPSPTSGHYCSGAPWAIRHNACHDIARACSCLGVLSVTSTATSTKTVTAIVISIVATESTTVVTTTATETNTVCIASFDLEHELTSSRARPRLQLQLLWPRPRPLL